MKALAVTLIATALLGGNAYALVEKDCQKNIVRFTQKFLRKNSQEIFNTKPGELTFEFMEFKNTTPGSYYQNYEVRVDVSWPSGSKNYPRARMLTLTLYSPFICDHLELQKLESQ